MSYPKQHNVAERLQDYALDALDERRDKAWSKINRRWRQARVDMRSFILDTYRHFFGNAKWSTISFNATGARRTLANGLFHRIDQFRNDSLALTKTAINDLYRESVLRHAWVLDQVTPPSYKVRIPYRLHLFEASRNFYRGDAAIKQLGERWNSWSDGYYSALMNNIQLGALNESSMSDAADEVDATRVGTPQSGLLDALQRLFDFMTVTSINDAVASVSTINEEADVVQIWETRRNLTVCDVCDENEGLTEEEVDDFIPAHPNCRCYWRIVPKSWADMLKNGSPDDYQTAVLMDAKGLVPNAMAIRDAEGNLAGYSTVDFQEWLSDRYAITGE